MSRPTFHRDAPMNPNTALLLLPLVLLSVAAGPCETQSIGSLTPDASTDVARQPDATMMASDAPKVDIATRPDVSNMATPDATSTTTPDAMLPAGCREYTVGGMPTGYIDCPGGPTHRREKRDCPSLLPRPERIGADGEACRFDSDCTARPNGYCRSHATLAGSGVGCDYGCIRDEECGAGSICACANPVGTCVKSSCTTDASCGAGLKCAEGYTGFPYPAGFNRTCDRTFACQTAGDTCKGKLDCPGMQYCGVTANGRSCESALADAICS